jgi:hypothetical protein
MCRARNGNGISSGASTGGNTISCGRGLPAAWNVNSRHTQMDCDCAWTYCVVSNTHTCTRVRAHTHMHTGQWPCCESSWDPQRASPHHTQTVSRCKHRNVQQQCWIRPWPWEINAKQSHSVTHSGHSCSMCASTLTFCQPDTHHSGGNANVQMVHASRWVVVVQVVMHVLMGAVPATTQHNTTRDTMPASWDCTDLSMASYGPAQCQKFLDLKWFLSWALTIKKVCYPATVTYNVCHRREQGTKVSNSPTVTHFDFPSTSMQYL